MSQLRDMLIIDWEFRVEYVEYLKRAKHRSLPSQLIKDLPVEVVNDLLVIWNYAGKGERKQEAHASAKQHGRDNMPVRARMSSKRHGYLPKLHKMDGLDDRGGYR